MLGLGKRTEFDVGNVTLEGERLGGTWKESEENHQEGDSVEQERFIQEERTAKRIIQKVA